MTRPALPLARARALVSGFPSRAVAIVGDAMLDQFLVGRVTRISPEAPVPVVAFEREETRLGGAANVAHNVRAFGAATSLVALAGRDDAAGTLVDLLARTGIASDTLAHSASRPTTRKTRVVTTRNQQVARIDYEDDREATAEEEDALTACVGRALGTADVVVVSDYQKGVVTAAVMASVIAAAARRGVRALASSACRGDVRSLAPAAELPRASRDATWPQRPLSLRFGHEVQAMLRGIRERSRLL